MQYITLEDNEKAKAEFSFCYHNNIPMVIDMTMGEPRPLLYHMAKKFIDFGTKIPSIQIDGYDMLELDLMSLSYIPFLNNKGEAFYVFMRNPSQLEVEVCAV